MKKFLLISILAATFMSSAASSLPDVLYLSGDFNNWQKPDTEAGRGYQLTDEDNDGIYTGSFELPGQSDCSFRIIAQADSPQTNSDILLGVRPEESEIFIFKGETETRTIGTVNAGYKRDICVGNWAGGTLNISVKLYKSHGSYTTGTVKLWSETQPAKPQMECVYLIGTFNDYRIPEGVNLNGAVPLPCMNSMMPVYEGMADIPTGEASIALCYIDPKTKETVYAGGGGMSCDMYSQTEGFAATMEFMPVTSGTFDRETDSLTIRNWSGGILTVRYEIIHGVVKLLWEGAPLNDFPEGDSLYIIMETDDGHRVIQNNLNIDEPTSIKYMIFTTENSLNPNPSTIWGVPEDINNRITESSTLKLSRGGLPIQIDCEDYMTASIHVDRTGRSVELYIQEFSDIVLYGYMTNWNFLIPENEEYYSQYKLTNEGNGLFTGTFRCPASRDTSFLFYASLSDSGLYPIGNSDSSPVAVSTDEWTKSGLVSGSDGVWALRDWNEDVNVDFQLDLRLRELRMKINSTGVESIDDTCSADTSYFTLQGVKVENPVSGIYIKVTAKGSERVYIR